MISIGLYRNQIAAAAAATIGAFGLGSVLAWTSMALPNLKEKIAEGSVDLDPISPETESWIGSILNIGALTACIIVGFLLDLIGRKTTILCLSVPFVVGWTLIAFARNHAMILVGRTITGFCGAGFSVAAPLFVSEMADDSVRGALGSSFQVMVTAGVLFSYLFGSFLTWQWLSIISGCIPIVCLAAMSFIPESPRYLVAKHKTEEANRALRWFRRKSGKEVEDEMRLVEASVNETKQQDSSFRDLFLPYNLLPAGIMIGIMLFQQLTGVNAVVFYTKEIFRSAGTSMSEDLSTILIGLIQFLATFSSIFLIDRAGRKLLLLVSCASMCGSLVLLGLFFQLQELKRDEGLGWLPLLSLVIFMVAFSIGFGPVPWVLLGELVPQKVKARVAALATCTNWTVSFFVTKWFDQLQKAIGIHWCYWMFAIFTAIGFTLKLILLPETKGRSVEDIEDYFGVPRHGEKPSIEKHEKQRKISKVNNRR